VTEKNTRKGKSYGLAFQRISLANGQGFYVEAAAIAESVIADRLESYLRGRDEILRSKKGETSLTLAGLIQLLNKHMIGDEGFTVSELDKFRHDRNKAVHEIARSYPGKPTMPVEQWINHARDAATAGAALARRVVDWHRRQLPPELKASKRKTGTNP
jgi:hypothetical protein